MKHWVRLDCVYDGVNVRAQATSDIRRPTKTAFFERAPRLHLSAIVCFILSLYTDCVLFRAHALCAIFVDGKHKIPPGKHNDSNSRSTYLSNISHKLTDVSTQTWVTWLWALSPFYLQSSSSTQRNKVVHIPAYVINISFPVLIYKANSKQTFVVLRKTKCLFGGLEEINYVAKRSKSRLQTTHTDRADVKKKGEAIASVFTLALAFLCFFLTQRPFSIFNLFILKRSLFSRHHVFTLQPLGVDTAAKHICHYLFSTPVSISLFPY